MSPMLLITSPEENNYLPKLARLMEGVKVKAFNGEIIDESQLALACKKAGIKQVVTTRADIIKLLLPADRSKEAKVSNYAGSILPLGEDIEVLIIPPLKQLYTVAYAEFLTKRFLSKFTKPNSWRKVSKFDWKFISPANYGELENDFETAILCGVDIETSPGLRITSISYTLYFPSGISRTWGMFVSSLEDIQLIRRLNDTKVPKVLQNGKYDSIYFHAYRAPLRSYYYDTVNMMHAWYAEFPKDLAFLQAFFIRDAFYWKDLSESKDPVEKMRYNCLDTWSTIEVAVTWLLEAPQWAKNNYYHEFTQVPICLHMESMGIKRDIQLTEKYHREDSQALENKLKSLQTMVGHPGFNPSSPKQVVKLMTNLGMKWEGRNAKPSSDDKNIQKAMLLHPINERVLGAINSYRSERKELSTYLPIGADAKEYKGRILYSINPHGTDTGRKSSKESSLALASITKTGIVEWKHLGLQIQNITAEGKVKDTFIADEGFGFAELDFRQAEARGVAYCSGDERLLEAVNSSQDFHSLNASAFFGIPYCEIYDDEKQKTLNKAIRDLAKRVNHGANYNMGALVLLETMGEKNVRKAQKLLSLPRHWTLIQICQYLLDTYTKTYPQVKGRYYEWIKRQVALHSKLVGPTGWTRYCFGNPSTNKLDLNGYVAHYTQNLNAMVLDEAVRRVYIKYGFDPDIKFLAQIHDSLFLQHRLGEEGEAKVKDIANLMVFPVPVTDCAGVTREMTVPVDIKFTGYRWSGKEIIQ